MRYLKKLADVQLEDMPLTVYGSQSCSDCHAVRDALAASIVEVNADVIEIRAVDFATNTAAGLRTSGVIEALVEVAKQNQQIPVVLTADRKAAIRWEDWPAFEESLAWKT